MYSVEHFFLADRTSFLLKTQTSKLPPKKPKHYLSFWLSAIFMFSRLATVLQELSGEEGTDGETQVNKQHRKLKYVLKLVKI